MFNLEGYNALVTGASGSIGGAIAKTLSDAGAKLVISGTNEAKLEKLKKSLATESAMLLCDLNHNMEVENLFARAEEELGSIDIIVNNAGVTKDTLLIKMSDNDWEKILQINLNTIFRLCRAATKSMMKRRYGRIINISSIVGFTGNPGQCNYVASKAAVVGFSKALAQEVAKRSITVNCIAPGFIDSPMTAKISDKVKEELLHRIPQGAIGQPEDIAAAALFLASKESGYITGQTIHVNGGMSML